VKGGSRRFFEHAIGTTKARPMEVVTDLAPVYQPRWKSSYRRLGIAPIGMAITVSKQITAG